MEMSIKDRLIILAMSVTGMIIFLLIAYDPLNILDTSQKWILGLIVAVANVPLLLYQRQRIMKKMKRTTK
jgi:Mn2+/Fe2+ NRAMP family transporter